MKFITDYKLENFILNTQWEDLPEEVQKRAVVCGVDLTIALLLGSKGQQFQAGLRMAREHYKEGKVPVVGSPETFAQMIENENEQKRYSGLLDRIEEFREGKY